MNKMNRKTQINISTPIKDTLILVGLSVIIDALTTLTSTLLVLLIFNDNILGFNITAIIDWFSRILNSQYWKYISVINYILTIPSWYLLTTHYIKKYEIPLKFNLSNIKKILPLIVVIVILNVFIEPIVEGKPYKLQALAEYNAHLRIGDGILGYGLEVIYYIMEGLWIATALYISSRASKWAGLIILLIFWSIPHIMHGIAGLVMAIAAAIVFENIRRNTDNDVISIVLAWMVFVLI